MPGRLRGSLCPIRTPHVALTPPAACGMPRAVSEPHRNSEEGVGMRRKWWASLGVVLALGARCRALPRGLLGPSDRRAAADAQRAERAVGIAGEPRALLRSRWNSASCSPHSRTCAGKCAPFEKRVDLGGSHRTRADPTVRDWSRWNGYVRNAAARTDFYNCCRVGDPLISAVYY